MKRNPRKVRWTKAYRKLAGKELAEDATFELERRRNRPQKYDREAVTKTLKAIGKIDAIRSKRQERFYEKRMAKAKIAEKKAEKVQLEKEIHLIKAPAELTEAKDKLRVRVAGKAVAGKTTSAGKAASGKKQKVSDAMQE
jgi:large subunit ribosomal protein L24e